MVPQMSWTLVNGAWIKTSKDSQHSEEQSNAESNGMSRPSASLGASSSIIPPASSPSTTSTELLSLQLASISTDENDPEGLKEVVVVAIGTGGRYYVCWKTHGGEYRQGETTNPQWLSSLTESSQ